MRKKFRLYTDNRSVTPVVGTILVVAIVVVLASVVGFYFLNFSSILNSPSPQADIDYRVNENVVYSDGSSNYNVDEIVIEHQGGSDIDADKLYIKSTDTRFRYIKNDNLTSFVSNSKIQNAAATKSPEEFIAFFVEEAYQSRVKISEITNESSFSTGDKVRIATVISDVESSEYDFSRINTRLKDSNVIITYETDNSGYKVSERK